MNSRYQHTNQQSQLQQQSQSNNNMDLFEQNKQNDIEFYKKRWEVNKKETETLKKENQVIKKELASLKETVTNIVEAKRRPTTAQSSSSSDQQFRIVLEFQRKRIDTLEFELDEIKNKYEKLLFENNQKQNNLNSQAQSNLPQSQILLRNFQNSSEEVIQLRKKNEELENKIKDITQQYGKEIGSLKGKLANQNAEIIMNSSQSNGFEGSQNQNFNYQKWQNKQIISSSQNNFSQSLDPIINRQPQVKQQNQNGCDFGQEQQAFNNNGFFSYTSKKR